MSARRIKPDLTVSLVIAALTGLPMVAISITIGQSTLSPALRILWLLVLFFVWAWVFCWTYNLQTAEPSPGTPGREVRSAEMINCRQFLIRLGASTAAITVVGAGVMLAQVETTSVIDTVAVDAVIENGDQKLVPVGGIAFAGARGISKVGVRADDGPWQEAQLRTPLSETTWIIWRYDWPFTAGDHTFEVRCAEGDGTPQIEESHPNRPSGAAGIHHREVSI